MTAPDLYNELAEHYHLIYADWEQSIQRQAAALDTIFRQYLGPGPHRIADVSCGIGTQALGLAQLGHHVSASDVASASVTRARREATRRGLAIDFAVAHMRTCAAQHRPPVDIVLSADNSVPHLLTDDDILTAFRAFFHCTRPGGLVVVTVRDYAAEDQTSPQLRPYGVRKTLNARHAVFQIWEWSGNHYDTSLYIVTDDDSEAVRTVVGRSRYYAVPIDTLLSLLTSAGFIGAHRLDGTFFQPVLVARRPEA